MENPEKCPNCGGTSFTRGFLQIQTVGGNPPAVSFLTLNTGEKPSGWWQRMFGTGRQLGREDMQARVCESCNNLQLFIKPKHQQ